MSRDVVGVLDRADPPAVRVTDASGIRHTVEEPYVSGDSLLAGADGCRSAECRRRGPPGIALADVRAVEIRGDRDYTLLWGTVLGTAAAAGLFYLILAESDWTPCC